MMYQVKKSQTIIDNKEFFLEDCKRCETHLKSFLDDTTWDYRQYNIFSVVMPSNNWFGLYSEIRNAVRKFSGYKKQMYIRAWLNCHKADEVLDWHTHATEYHGFVSFDDYPTTTIFQNYEVKTEVGNIYVGFGNNPHSVRVDEEFHNTRYTLAFDVVTGKNHSMKTTDDSERENIITGSQLYPLL